MSISGEKIKAKAKESGFDFCGIAKAEPLEELRSFYESYIAQKNHRQLNYLKTQLENRLNPLLLLPGARSVIALLLNYYPPETIPEEDNFIIAKYAYGKDYHPLMKKKMNELIAFIKKEYGEVKEKIFVDSGAFLEKTWAQKCGTGWQGKNTLLINRTAGSFFFIGIILTDLELEPDQPEQDHCGSCRKCQDACPTGALSHPYQLDISRCTSYHTIESKKEIPEELKGKFLDRIYGCDICQDVCPFNSFSKPHHEADLLINQQVLKMRKKDWIDLTPELFTELFTGTPVERVGYDKLMRTIKKI